MACMLIPVPVRFLGVHLPTVLRLLRFFPSFSARTYHM